MRSGGAGGTRLLPQWIGYTGWFLAAFFFFYAWVLRVSPSVMVNDLMAEFQVSGAVLGNLSAFYFYAYALLQMPVGLAHDRWGPRRVLTAMALVTGVGCLLFAFAPDIEIAYLGRLLIGAGVAFAFVGSLVLAGNWFPPRRFALLSGLGMTGGLLGGFAGQIGLGPAVESQGWRDAMLWLGLVGVGLAVLTWLLTRDRRDPSERAAPNMSPEGVPESVFKGLVRVAKRPQTLLIAVFAGSISAPMLSFGALWAVPFTTQLYDISQAEAAGIVSWNALGFAAGGPCWGWLSDRIARRKLPKILGLLGALLSLSVLLYVPDLSTVAFRALLFLNGLMGAVMAVSYATAREHNAGSMTGAALGLVNMAAVLSGAVFQPIVGWLLDLQWDGTLVGGARVYSVESFRQAFLVLPAVYVLALVAVAFVRETRCQPIGPPEGAKA